MVATGKKSAEDESADRFEQWFADVTLVAGVTSRPDVVVALDADEFQAFQEASERLLAKAGIDTEEMSRRNRLILTERDL